MYTQIITLTACLHNSPDVPHCGILCRRLQARARTNLLEEVNRSMKLIRFERDHLSLEVRRVRDVERPPIATIPAYRERAESLKLAAAER